MKKATTPTTSGLGCDSRRRISSRSRPHDLRVKTSYLSENLFRIWSIHLWQHVTQRLCRRITAHPPIRLNCWSNGLSISSDNGSVLVRGIWPRACCEERKILSKQCLGLVGRPVLALFLDRETASFVLFYLFHWIRAQLATFHPFELGECVLGASVGKSFIKILNDLNTEHYMWFSWWMSRPNDTFRFQRSYFGRLSPD